jgi:hypothetical protein
VTDRERMAMAQGIGTVYASRSRIADSYIADAAAEAIIVAGWAVAVRDRRATAGA